MKNDFKAVCCVKITRQHNETKREFIKRCRANNKAYRAFMRTRFKIKPYTITQLMAIEEKYRTIRWDKRHPKPEPDLFGNFENYIKEREAAIERIRDVVVSIYDKLPLVGRFRKFENVYTVKGALKTLKPTYYERKVAQLKDINMEGHNVTNLSKDSKLLRKAESVTNEIHRRTPSLVATVLQDHIRKRGRMILPRAA